MTTAKMDDFNEYWTTEKARRRRLWPARYKSFLRQHLSQEEIKARVFRYGFNDNIAIELRQRHFCANNPIIYPGSEESLKTRLENLTPGRKIISTSCFFLRFLKSPFVQTISLRRPLWGTYVRLLNSTWK